MKISKFKNDIIALIFLILLALSVLTFSQHAYLAVGSYRYAVNMQKALAGQEVGLFYDVAGYFYRLLVHFYPSNADSLTSFLFILPYATSIGIVIVMYLLLRQLFTLEASLFSTLMLIFAQPFVSFGSSGVVSEAPFFLLLILMSILSFVLSLRLNPLLAAIAGILLASTLHFSLGPLLSVLFFLAMLLQILYNYLTYREFRGLSYSFVVALVLFLISALLLGYGQVNLNLDIGTAFINYYQLIPFFIAALVVWAIAREGELGLFLPMFFVASCIIAIYGQVYLALPGFIIGVANFVEHIRLKIKGYYVNWAFFAIIVFLLLLRFLSPQQDIMVSIILGVVFTYIVELYKDRLPSAYVNYGLIMSCFLMLGFTSVFFVQAHYASPSKDVYDSMLWIKGNTPKYSVVGGMVDGDLIEYVADRKSGNYSDLITAYLSGSSPVSTVGNNLSYMVLDDPFGDEKTFSAANLEVFAFNGYLTDPGVPQCATKCAFFISNAGSQSGNPACGRDMSCLFIPVDTNNLPTGAVTLLYGTVEQANVPFGKLLFLRKNANGAFVSNDMTIYPKDPNSNLLKLYFPDSFGTVPGLKKVYTSQDNLVSVFQIQGVG